MTEDQEQAAIETIELAMFKMSPTGKSLVKDYLRKLTHYRDSTVGLWVTDVPKSVDEKKLMFQLKF